MNRDHFKKYSIGSIVRPDGDVNAFKHQLGFFVSVLDALEISFPNDENDPARLIKDYIDGRISVETLTAKASVWRSIFDDSAAIREFRERNILLARLAVCLLYRGETNSAELGDNLSWFLEVLDALEVDMKVPNAMMIEYFEYR